MNVARSEGQLLTLARALVDGTHPTVIAPLVGDAQPLKPAIGPTAMGILESTLARGAVLTLVRNSGWRVEKRPGTTAEGEPGLVEGRLWERHPPPELRFTDWSFRLLRLMLTNALVSDAKPLKPAADPGDGDRILALLAARTLIALQLRLGLAAVRHEPLVQLAFAWWVDPVEVDWRAFVAGRPWMIEGLHDLLAEAWVSAEREKMVMRSPEQLSRGSQRQAAVLNGYLDALEALDRPDLADFLLTAGEQLLKPGIQPGTLAQRELDPTTSLRDRTDATRASSSLLDALIRLETFHARARAVRFFDDEYEASQARLARWEQYGDARARRVCEAQEILHR